MKAIAIAVFVACFVALKAGECDSYEREKLNEGYRTCVYKDSKGIPTVGVGFNLDKFGAKAEIESVGADYNKVLNGTQCLTDGQIETLFNRDMDTAKVCARGWISSSLPSGPESAINDMAFNMGCATLHEFGTLKGYIEKGDYSGAAEDMKGTAWCRQVGYRCDHDVACMRG